MVFNLRYVKAFIIPFLLFVIAPWWILNIVFFDMDNKTNEMILAIVYLAFVFGAFPISAILIWKHAKPEGKIKLGS